MPKLISQLYEESIFISIGHREFQIPRDIFTGPGNSPNFFSLGFAVFFSTPDDLFPGLDREGLIRPPSILPPSVLPEAAPLPLPDGHEVPWACQAFFRVRSRPLLTGDNASYSSC